MDENEFKEVLSGYDPKRCFFGKAILLGCADCGCSQRVLIGEREAVSCLSHAGRARCGDVLLALREKAAFALGMTQARQNLPHGKEVKVECGGLVALAQLAGLTVVSDVDAVLREVLRRFGETEALPYEEIVRSISRYSLRKRGRRGG